MTSKIVLGHAKLAIGAVLAWMVFGRTDKRRSALPLSDGRVVFAVDRMAFSGWLLTAALLAWTAARDLMRAHAQLWDALGPAVLGSAAISILFMFPGTIVVSMEGLEQAFWFRPNKRIRWKEIEEIEASGKNILVSMITITSFSGTKITYSDHLADPPRFLFEIQQHCGEDLPPNFPRESVDGL